MILEAKKRAALIQSENQDGGREHFKEKMSPEGSISVKKGKRKSAATVEGPAHVRAQREKEQHDVLWR